MFYDDLSAHLATPSWLNWVDEDDDEDEVGAWKKSQKTLDTTKIIIHQNKTRSTGSECRAGKELDSHQG